VEGEENRPYRRVTLEWYRDLETGTFLLKMVAEGEGIKGGRREATFTLSPTPLIRPSLLPSKRYSTWPSMKTSMSPQ